MGTDNGARGTSPKAFADHCCQPCRLNGSDGAATALAPQGARVDFYEPASFTSAPQSPVTGAAATRHRPVAAKVPLTGLNRNGCAPGINDPDWHRKP